MSFSIIIPAFNAARELEMSLPPLIAAAGPDDEIFVVDDASTDATTDVASALGVRVLRLTRNAGPAEARNHGVKYARGAILVFVDADVIIHVDALDRIQRILHDEPEVSAVFGSYDATPEATGIVSRYRNLLHHFVHQQGNPEAVTFWAGLGAVRRVAFRGVGGFDGVRFPQPSIEDIELGYRLRKTGHRIRLEAGLQGTHLKGWTFWSMIRTDITRRALPWARLILQSGNTALDLNLRADQRWSALFVALAVVMAAAALVRSQLWGLALAALMGVLVLNWRFYLLLWRQGGLSLVVTATPLHLLYFLYSGLTFLYAWAEWRLRGAAAALHKGA